SVVAWRLPGGETHYDFARFDEWGNVTNAVSTYSKADGSLGTRTNQFPYALNTYTNLFGTLDASGNVINAGTNTFTIRNLLTAIIAANGSNIWSLSGFDVVTWTNDYPALGQTNRNL